MAKREILFYKHYFKEFYVAQDDKVRRKIAQVLMNEYFGNKQK